MVEVGWKDDDKSPQATSVLFPLLSHAYHLLIEV